MFTSELKQHVKNANGESHFFERSTMRFFGDTMKNYGVRRSTIIADFDADRNYHPSGVERDVWELYRKRPVKHGNQSSAYFDATTFKRVFSKKGD